MKRLFLFLTIIPICARAEFETLDSVNLDLIKQYTYGLNYDVNTYLPYLEPIEDTVSSIDNRVNNLYQLFYSPANGPDNHSVIYWSGLGSKAVYDFIGSSSIVNFPAIDSLRVLSSTSPDAAPSYNLWSFQSQTASDFKSFLHGYVNRQFPLLYSLSSGVSDLDARAWRLQNQGAYTTNVLGRGIGDSWSYHVLPSPFSDAGVGWSFFDFNLNPTESGNYLKTRTFSSSPDLGSSIVNFQKWFIDDYTTKRDFWDSLSVARANTFYKISTNYYGLAVAYDLAISNIVVGIREDNKKSSDVFSNLWSNSFSVFFNVGTQQLRYMSSPNSENIDLSNINSSSQPTVNSNSTSLSHRLTVYFNGQNRVLTSINNYLYNFMKQFQDVRSLISSLPSSISSALSSNDVTIDNPTVHVTVDNPPDISTTLDTSYTPAYGYDIADTGYIYSDINPNIDKGMPDSTLLHSLTGDFFADSIVVLQTLSKQHTTLNVATISILTNVQVIADYLRGDDHSDPDFTTDKSDIDSQISGASFIDFGRFDELDSNYRFTTHLGFAENVYLPDVVEVDFSSIYDITYSFFKVRHQLKVDDLIFDIDISKYHWFFKLMRGASIVLIVIFNIQLYILLGRVFLWLLSVVFKSICTNT